MPASRNGLASCTRPRPSCARERTNLQKLVTLEMGKLFREAQGEVELSADILDYYADNAEKFLGAPSAEGG